MYMLEHVCCQTVPFYLGKVSWWILEPNVEYRPASGENPNQELNTEYYLSTLVNILSFGPLYVRMLGLNVVFPQEFMQVFFWSSKCYADGMKNLEN